MADTTRWKQYRSIPQEVRELWSEAVGASYASGSRTPLEVFKRSYYGQFPQWVQKSIDRDISNIPPLSVPSEVRTGFSLVQIQRETPEGEVEVKGYRTIRWQVDMDQGIQEVLDQVEAVLEGWGEQSAEPGTVAVVTDTFWRGGR